MKNLSLNKKDWRMKVSTFFVFLLLSCIFSTTTYAQATTITTYTITNLGTIPGYESYLAYDVNDQGEVAGEAYNGLYTSRGFVWTNGVMRPLPKLHDYDSFGHAESLTSDHIVGDSSSGFGEAVVWSRSQGTVIKLAALPEQSITAATGVNQQGTIVGTSRNYVSDAHAVMWTGPEHLIHQLPSLPDLTSSEGMDINNRGQVVGYSYTFTPGLYPMYATLWQQDGKTVNLKTLGYSSIARAISNSQSPHIIGWSTSRSDENSEAVLWQDNTIHGLGFLPTDNWSDAHDVNDAGQVVGWSWGPNTQRRAFLWQAETGMGDLNDFIDDLDWSLREARGINNQGQIVGRGRYKGQNRAFLLTPTEHRQ